MKQFAQCTHCHQWYARTATAPVEIYQGDRLHCIAIWCVSCIREVEQRAVDRATVLQPQAASTSRVLHDEQPFPETLQHLMEEHVQLMDHALQDEEDVLVPVIQNFIERARLYASQGVQAGQQQRLLGHVHYWETFLKALHTHDGPGSDSDHA